MAVGHFNGIFLKNKRMGVSPGQKKVAVTVLSITFEVGGYLGAAPARVI